MFDEWRHSLKRRQKPKKKPRTAARPIKRRKLKTRAQQPFARRQSRPRAYQRIKPWEIEGISQSTWYRYQKDPERRYARRSWQDRAIAIETIVAAARRGLSAAEIARAAGVTRSAVSARLLRYEKKFGRIEKQRRFRHQVQYEWSCAHCGVVQWRTDTATKFCSTKCRAEHCRELADEAIERAIAWRRQGQKWAAIQKCSSSRMCKHCR
jgi:hypothetical protein